MPQIHPIQFQNKNLYSRHMADQTQPQDKTFQTETVTIEMDTSDVQGVDRWREEEERENRRSPDLPQHTQ